MFQTQMHERRPEDLIAQTNIQDRRFIYATQDKYEVNTNVIRRCHTRFIRMIQRGARKMEANVHFYTAPPGSKRIVGE